MQLRRSWLLWAAIVVFAIISKNASYASTTVYVAQSAGTFSGGTACNGKNAESVATFNSGTESAGSIYYLCGTITTGIKINGSGSSGSVITMIWDTGARVSQPVAQGIYLNGNSAYWLFDGGVACGPGTNCDAVEAANQTGYATGQTGIIEATANGSALANQNPTSQAFYGCSSGCHDIEIRNLIIRNMYQHTNMSDSTNNVDGGTFIFSCVSCASGTISIHDSSIHDNGNAVSLTTTSGTTLNVYNNDFYRNNWAVAPTGRGTRMVNIHDNHFHDASNWDTTDDAFHHNGVHVFMTTATDSLGINIYNNLSDGNWGNCCTTATQVFIDTGGFSVPDNVNVFNNVVIQYPGNLAPAWEYSATTGLVANNTALGVCTTPSNTYALGIGSGATGLNVENNFIQCYGQLIQFNPGATFTLWDYNTYGPPGISGVGTWDHANTGFNAFAAWQTACSCDSHGQSQSTLHTSAIGAPQGGSPLVGQGASALIGAGANLTSLGITALDSDTSAGGTRTPVSRPTTGPWTAGAFQFQSPPPPTNTVAPIVPVSN